MQHFCDGKVIIERQKEKRREEENEEEKTEESDQPGQHDNEEEDDDYEEDKESVIQVLGDADRGPTPVETISEDSGLKQLEPELKWI